MNEKAGSSRAHVKWLNQKRTQGCKEETGMTKVSTMTSKAATSDFIGLDLSDKTAAYVVLSAEGQVIKTEG